MNGKDYQAFDSSDLQWLAGQLEDQPTLVEPFAEVHANLTVEVVDAAVAGLQSTVAAERRAALTILGVDFRSHPYDSSLSAYLGAVSLGPLLRAVVDEIDPQAQALSIKALAETVERIRMTDFSTLVTHHLASPIVEPRFALAAHLYRLASDYSQSTAALEAVEVLAADDDADVRYYALSSLVDDPEVEPEVVERIARSLQDDEDVQIQALVEDWLGRVGPTTGG